MCKKYACLNRIYFILSLLVILFEEILFFADVPCKKYRHMHKIRRLARQLLLHNAKAGLSN
jgi:hypothetical protein